MYLFHLCGNTYCEWDAVLLLPKYKSPYLNTSLLGRSTASVQVHCHHQQAKGTVIEMCTVILKLPGVHNRNLMEGEIY